MTTVRDALTLHLDRATAMRDTDAERVLRSALFEVLDHPDDAVAVLRRQIDDRGRLAGTHPDAAAAMRREAEVLTIVLASAGY